MAIDGIIYRHSPDRRKQNYDVSFFGDTIATTVTHDPEAVTEWITLTEELNLDVDQVIVGLDAEWRPSYTGSSMRNPVAVVQICVGDRCLIYQIIHSRYIPDALRDFFFHENYIFVGVGVNDDLEKLVCDYEIGNNARFWELGEIAADTYDIPELECAGLNRLANFVLDKDMEKSRRVTMSRWDWRRLTAEQIKYACLDAFVSFEIGRVLNT
ncbi:hypothetical protein BUALT_Bualt12G0040200 [Buddleja alternifolia]|uniref:3'-5' exonuclease domain-containing protein n=1 Tax=Buddleja alternifolia TaxID=168488 RepID=A0AAV6WNR1_9LAMI|nr:hypothetical protein BUALT_Bualt12G0040200 [Buddleja alternifolia]